MATREGKSVSRRGFLQGSATAAVAVAVGSAVSPPAVHAAGSDEIRVGLVGCGGRGRGAVANAIEAAGNVKVIALADLFQDAIDETLRIWADRPKDQFDTPRDRCFVGWDAWKQLLQTNVNYVILATPPGFRPMMMQGAIEAGKHVFAEKPVAVDPAGVRSVLATAEQAEKKNLGIVVGTQRRHQASYIETIKRLKDGAIGRIISGQVYWIQGGAWMKPRKPEWSDMEWQLRNWPYFCWLSGDHIVEQHMHMHDVANWVLGGPPRLCIGMGGRQVRTDPAYGHVYDHFAVDYEYPNGVHVLSMCRQQDNTYGRQGELFQGQKGSAYPSGRILVEGEEPWGYEGERDNPYVVEHADLIKSIRAGKPINEGKQGAESTLTAIMGRMSAYTGKLVTWKQALESKLDLMPRKLEFGPLPTPPVAMPGVEPLI